MTVMFEDGVDQATMDAIGKQIESRTDLVREVRYVSADQAWEEFAQDYFPEDQQNLKSGFKDNDNPLLYSASYEVYARSVEVQNQLREYIQQMDGVRVVNQATDVTSTLSSFNKMIGYISIAIIAILLAVAIFLISNTVAIGISVRKEGDRYHEADRSDQLLRPFPLHCGRCDPGTGGIRDSAGTSVCAL